jgi:hypothetical protein
MNSTIYDVQYTHLERRDYIAMWAACKNRTTTSLLLTDIGPTGHSPSLLQRWPASGGVWVPSCTSVTYDLCFAFHSVWRYAVVAMFSIVHERWLENPPPTALCYYPWWM